MFSEWRWELVYEVGVNEGDPSAPIQPMLPGNPHPLVPVDDRDEAEKFYERLYTRWRGLA